MRHKNRKRVKIAISSCVYIALIAGIILGFGNSIFGVIFGPLKASMISNAPRFEYQEREKDEKIATTKNVLIGTQYGMLQCERIDLKVPLYYGDYDKLLENGAGTSINHVLPGEKGTALIGGHDTTFFAPLEQIKEGDVITIDTIYGSDLYKVTGTKAENVNKYEADNQDTEVKIILYTCYPFGDTMKNREGRFYVYATKQ